MHIETHERVQFVDVTGQVAREVAASGVRRGAVLVYVPHTTAGVTINENADPSVRRDLQTRSSGSCRPTCPSATERATPTRT